jgi:AraC-like DNA-binding protein
MLETDYNITQISREVGFSNLTHFNRTFKKITGVAPREKKKLYQK